MYARQPSIYDTFIKNAAPVVGKVKKNINEKIITNYIPVVTGTRS